MNIENETPHAEEKAPAPELITSTPWSSERQSDVEEKLAVEVARRVVSEPDTAAGRSGTGVVEIPMPADPSRVVGWEGEVRH